MLIRPSALGLQHTVDQLQELMLEEGVAWVTMETLLLSFRTGSFIPGMLREALQCASLGTAGRLGQWVTLVTETLLTDFPGQSDTRAETFGLQRQKEKNNSEIKPPHVTYKEQAPSEIVLIE